MLPAIRSFVKLCVPKRLLAWRARLAERGEHNKYQNCKVEEIFANIYNANEWGEVGRGKGFFSGSGSHDPRITNPYIREVSALLKGLPQKPVIVDLGSGDFNVGKNFVDLSDKYFACDIVPELQAFNRTHFMQPNLEFLCLNIIEDDLPDGDIVLLRQVLQHLSNDQINNVVKKCQKYDKWVVTEHLPLGEKFRPNADMSAGSGIRLLINSGIVLTKPPFNVLDYKTRVLCEHEEYGGVIRTLFFERV